MATYNISREDAADILGVSTRSVDRYIKRGKLSYKKVANKVYIAEEDVRDLQNSFGSVQQHASSERISETPATTLSKNSSDGDFGQQVDKFLNVLHQKDKMVEDKNKVIFMLQQRVGELETKLQHMIALPDYNSEKQEIIVQKDRLEQEIKHLKSNFKKEQTKSTTMTYVVIGMIVVVILYLVFTSNGVTS